MLQSRLRAAALLGGIMFLAASGVGFLPAYAQPSAPPMGELARGISLYKSGDTKGAIEVFRAAVKSQKDNAEAWGYLGLALNKDGQAREARKAFERAVKLRPDDKTSRSGLAYTLLLADRLAEAKREAEATLALDAANVVALYVIAAARLRENEFAEALSRAEAILKLDPTYRPALLLKVQALYRTFAKGRSEAAAQHNKRQDKEKSPREGQAREEKRRKDYSLLKEAADVLEKVIRLSPTTAEQEQHRENLEALRFYSRFTEKPDGVSDIAWSGPTLRPVITYREKAKYTDAARGAEVQGSVILMATFASDGTIKHILTIQGLSHGLTEQAILAARKIKFIPAMKDGQPITVILQLEYNFSLY
jgi:tetratricopeptide (TPR) repeat protein